MDRQRSACPAWSTATWNRKAYQQYCMCHCTCTVFHWPVVGLILMRSGSREPSVCPPQVVFCLNYMMISWGRLIQFFTVTLNFAQINNKRSSWCVFFFLKLGFGCWCNYIFIPRVNCSVDCHRTMALKLHTLKWKGFFNTNFLFFVNQGYTFHSWRFYVHVCLTLV